MLQRQRLREFFSLFLLLPKNKLSLWNGVPEESCTSDRVSSAFLHYPISSIAGHAPAGLLASIPAEFKTIGFDTHGKFDQIAESAEKNFDPKHTAAQVTELLGNCVACHKMYRMDVDSSKK